MDIASAIGAIMGTMDAIRAAIEARDYAKVADATIELRGKILEMQTLAGGLHDNLAAVKAERADLERQVAELNGKIKERASYVLYEIAPGRFVYKFQPTGDPVDAPHYLCQACYDQGVKSVLHITEKISGVLNRSGNHLISRVPIAICLVNRNHSFYR